MKLAGNLRVLSCWFFYVFLRKIEGIAETITNFCEIFECQWGITMLGSTDRNVSESISALELSSCSIFLNEFCVVVCPTISVNF